LSLFWSGAHDDARTTLEAAAAAARDADNRIAVIHASGCLAALDAECGERHRAAQRCERVQLLAEAQGLSEHWATAIAEATRARIETRPEIARAAAQHAVMVSRRGMARIEAAYSLVTLAEIQSRTGTAVHDVVRDARETVATCPDPGILASMTSRLTRYVPERPRQDVAAPSELTARELDVLRLLGVALTQREIARTLYVSANTVKTHTRNLYAKLGASTRVEAVERAHQLGLL
jgi:LuxR family maltose regulon positive regulatory protein